jgi:hypothetical protein
MTFEQAIIKKQSLGFDTKTIDGINFKVFVTPFNEVDFSRYLNEIRGYFLELTDVDAKQYSTNAQFKIMGLWFDEKDIIYEQL